MSESLVHAYKSTTVRFILSLVGLQLTFRVLGSWMPELAARLAQRIFLTPRRHPQPERERRWLAAAERFEVAVGGHRLAAWSWGAGEPVLLAHGWAGRGAQMGALAEAIAAAGRRAVSFDMPGHGESSGRRSSLIEMAEAVAGMVSHLGGVRAVIAHSAGAAATTVSMRSAPAVDRLIYVAPPIDLGEFAHQFAGMLGIRPRVRERMRERIEERFGIRWAELTGPVLAPKMDRPLLVFHDRGDREVPWDRGRRLAADWPGARLVTTEGLGHHRILRDEGVVRQVLSFLDADLSGEPAVEGR